MQNWKPTISLHCNCLDGNSIAAIHCLMQIKPWNIWRPPITCDRYSPLYLFGQIAEQDRSKSGPMVQNMYMKSRAKPEKIICLFSSSFWYFSTTSVSDVRGISEISQRASSNNGSITQSSPLWKWQIGEPFDSESKGICCQFVRGNSSYMRSPLT